MGHALLENDSWQVYTSTWVAPVAGELSIEFPNVSGKPWTDAISDVKRVEPEE